MNNFVPCPQCGGQSSERMKFTWWGGMIGPKILTHVKCPNCNTKYNGKTGKDNTTNIIIYSVAVLAIAFVLMLLLFFVMGVFFYFSNAR